MAKTFKNRAIVVDEPELCEASNGSEYLKLTYINPDFNKKTEFFATIWQDDCDEEVWEAVEALGDGEEICLETSKNGKFTTIEDVLDVSEAPKPKKKSKDKSGGKASYKKGGKAFTYNNDGAQIGNAQKCAVESLGESSIAEVEKRMYDFIRLGEHWAKQLKEIRKDPDHEVEFLFYQVEEEDEPPKKKRKTKKKSTAKKKTRSKVVEDDDDEEDDFDVGFEE